MWHYGEGVYPVITGYEWVPAAPTPVQVREPSAPTPKPQGRPRRVAPAPQALGYMRHEVNWLQQQPIEHTVLFSLDEAGQVCGCTRIAGTADRCEIDVGYIVKEAQGHAAVSVVALHNHPSKTVAEPSAHDDQATDALREALSQAGIGLFDHFIVARHHLHSYRESAMEPEWLREAEERRESALWAPYGGRRPF
jgi:RadC-like JAB domain